MPMRLEVRASLAFVVLMAAPAHGQPAPPVPTNDDCMACHAEPSITRASGQPVLVDAAAFAASIHGQIALTCVDCHADLARSEIPHADKLAPVDCARCHPQAVTEYAKGIHAKARAAGQTAAATCVSCHGSHDIRPSKDPESRTYFLNLPRTCAECHGNNATIAKAGIHGGNVSSMFDDSIHGQALTKGGLVVAPNCSSCHGAHEILPKTEPDSPVARANVAATCGRCHQGILNEYSRGMHSQQVAQGNPQAPVCITCHSAHQITKSETETWQVDVISECGTCHTEKIHTYRDTFHGQVTQLGYTRVAKCSDCHGAHAMLPVSDPGSPVSEARRVETCRKCHPRANENFAKFHPHADPGNVEHHAPLYYTTKFMQLLLAGVFGFFGIHTTLWFQKSWRVRNEQGRSAARADSTGDGGDA